MLSFTEKNLGRRSFLRIGSLGLGGLSLSNLLAAKALAAKAGSAVKDKSVVFLFMHGGPSQTETFDPKMTAPAGVRSVTGEVKTTLPGVTYGATFQKLARLAHKMSVVRSFTTGNGNHDIKPIVCNETLGANLGSLYARVAGTNHPVSGMPRNVALFPRAVEPKSQERVTQFGKFDSTGSLGPGYTPFIPGGGGDLQQDMLLNLPRGRLDDRRGLLSGLDNLKKSPDGRSGGIDRFREQAFDTLLGGAGDAFDLSKEDPKLVARYDTAPLVRPNEIGRQWNNYNNYVDNARTLGKLMLMARRLCERGCGFVTVTTNFVWDMHADTNNATIQEGMRYCGLPFDHAVSTFLQDVEERGLSDDILLVVCLEPVISRDHIVFSYVVVCLIEKRRWWRRSAAGRTSARDRWPWHPCSTCNRRTLSHWLLEVKSHFVERVGMLDLMPSWNKLHRLHPRTHRQGPRSQSDLEEDRKVPQRFPPSAIFQSFPSDDNSFAA